jgi:carbon storage regulator
MLYLSRKVGESIIINDKIEVKVIEVSGKNIKLGFEFPKSATVLRKEVYDKVVEENKAAADSSMDSENQDYFTKFLQKMDSKNEIKKEE